jgi:hypothetical protein
MNKIMLSLAILLTIPFTTYANDPINTYLCKAKISDMQNNDFPSQQKRLKKETGKDITLKIDEESFKSASFDASEYLGSTNVSVMSYVVNAPNVTKENFGEKVKVVVYQHSPSADPAQVTLKDGTLTISKNYEHNWTAGHGVKASLDPLFSK